MSEEKQELKVGDELAFFNGCGDRSIAILPITKITPSGRMVCGRYILNPNLTTRGKSGIYGPYQGHPLTDKIRRQYLRQQNLRVVKSAKYEDLGDDILAKIAALIQNEKE